METPTKGRAQMTALRMVDCGLRIVKRCSRVGVAIVMGTLVVSSVHAEGVEPRVETAREPEISDRVEKSVTKACDWLAKNQGKDGALKSSYSCASTALAGLAWLAAGSTPYEGVYAHNIRLALD